MSLLHPAAFRIASTRSFSTASPTRASMLFALSALSNRQETQHFAQRSRLNRVEHSPALELIRESEVKPFTKQEQLEEPIVEAKQDAGRVIPTAGSTLDYSQAKPSAPTFHAITPPSAVDAAMLQTLQQMSAQLATLEARLVEMGIETEKDVRRTGALVTILVAGAVAGLGIWKFWPPESVRGEGKEFARKHVQERTRVLPVDVVSPHHAAATGPGAVMGEPAVFSTVPQPAVPVSTPKTEDVASGSSWRSLFWKKD